ncbi:E3 ubiquitin-protein ligase BRE1 [Colletotrichum aenigma]|uniref:E3 ubiquitin-protein ligase BRE1 n=1 Tax=Colletotrichum aenigma TaxID=1215731 RepID=UPI00187237FD|nr:E3 ubiquitin-protein ligase BRE1 [Colletotrichum aenigma]KAF5522073.1 E3 ubiquitin-protein ligase BRE1 [Colletotrichum aenigma]
MEDRKRPPISTAEDLAPPSKRHQTVNGSKSKGDSGDTAEEHWIENYQKGAIYRQLQETKREKADFESRVEQLQKNLNHREDHIRIIEAWWKQVLEEMEQLVDPALPLPSGPTSPPYITSTHFKDNEEFQRHLGDTTADIRKRAEAVINRIASARGEITPNIADLETRVNSLLAQQKDYLVKLDRANQENEQLSEDLNKASLRFFKAEKRMDRLKSAQVQKLEQQFIASAKPTAAGGENGSDNAEANGNAAEALIKFEEASAVVAKQKEQLEAAQADIKTLQEENSALKARREGLTDEDFIRTDVFKQFKSQNEDLIKRVNHLEATNKQLKEEAEKLQAERTAFRTKLHDEAQGMVIELERQVEERDADLTRIRAARDEWYAKANMLETREREEKQAHQHLKELTGSQQDRITSMELELQRLKPEDQQMADPDPELDTLPAEELLAKYKKLQQDFESINKELPALQQAYKRSMTLAQKKVMDFTALEERVAAALAEKQKADQKYFAVKKDADMRDRELGVLRSQHRKSSEIVSQLKEVEAQHRVLISNLEKQLSDLKQANAAMAAEHKKMEATSSDAARRADSYKNQINELSGLVKSRDAAVAAARERTTTQEAEVERLKVRADMVQKDKDEWKRKALSNSSEEEEMLRTFALCTVCRNNFKDTALKTCGHLFCHQCVDDRISNRMRKCPNCSRAFDRLDVMSVHH